jgi:hypothetical protein
MLCYFGLEKQKKESGVGRCDDKPNINEKKIRVSTRTLEEITIKFRYIRIVVKKKLPFPSSCLLASLHIRVKQHLFPVDRLL